MSVAEHLVLEALRAPVEAADADAVDLATRQPGVVRFLEARLGAGSDAFAVALDGAVTIHRAFAAQLGIAAPRAVSSLLERATAAPPAILAERQPALATWLGRHASSPPVPLTADEREQVAAALTAVLFALDQMATGRPVP